MEEIDRKFKLREKDSKTMKCLKWVLRDARPITRLLDHLRDVESGLSLVLLALSLYSAFPEYTENILLMLQVSII